MMRWKHELQHNLSPNEKTNRKQTFRTSKQNGQDPASLKHSVKNWRHHPSTFAVLILDLGTAELNWQVIFGMVEAGVELVEPC